MPLAHLHHRYLNYSILAAHEDLFHSTSGTLQKAKFHCCNCNSSFSSKLKRWNHVRKEHARQLHKPRMKMQCFKRFQESNFTAATQSYDRSPNRQQGDRDTSVLQCIKCLQCFVCDIHLKQHQCVPVLTNYTCKLCLTAFSSAHRLHDHMKFHPKEPLYQCQVCYKWFALQDDLVTHECLKHFIKLNWTTSFKIEIRNANY